MKSGWRTARMVLLSATIAGSISALVPTTAQANWLTSLTKTAGKTASHTHPDLAGPIGRAAGHLADLPAGTKGIAAHATPDGHWQFANREGQVFTAGTADELKRALPTLAPEAADGKIAIFLSEDSVFASRAHLDKLPAGADLNLVTAHGTFPLSLSSDGAVTVRFKPNVSLNLDQRADFDEAAAYLSRPLNASNIRTLAIESGPGKPLSSAPRRDPVTKAPQVDAVDVNDLPRALSAIRGQTALIVGRIENTKITFQPASGGEISRDMADILKAARENDVNVVVLHADTPRQPGGQNWLWQRIEVGGLDAALSKSTFGDFLDALGAKRGPLSVGASADGTGRIRLTAAPSDTGGPVASAQETLGELLGNLTGEVASKAVDVYARDGDRQRELDARLIPGVPTYIQIPYLVQVFVGLLAWGVSRSWWTRIWPPRQRRAGEGRLAHWAKSLPNLAAYLLAFLPIAGGFAFIWHALVQTWAAVTAPFRWIGKLLRRRVEV